MADLNFSFTIDNFNEGYSPLAHTDQLTFVGNKGQASDMRADIISRPGFLTQSPGLANLTNGTQAGVVDQLIRHILDEPTAADVTYAIGTSKLFKLSSTTVASGGSPSWPQAVTDMTSGESVIRLKANIYGFFNKASGGDILKMPLSTEVIDPDWGSATDVALESAPHPSCAKEDIMLFGNGRYVGVYIEGAATLDCHKLDFGEGTEVADIVYSGGFWYIAVNSGQGKKAQIYLYDGGALSNLLSDEAGVGDQQIGFLYVYNGLIFVAYEDISSDGYRIGYLAGREVKPLRYFRGSLPNHRQKALYKNTIIFPASTDIMSFGASVEQLPLQISTLADGGYATIGAVACPFGVPMIASTETTNYKLAKFSGYSVDSNYKTIFVDTANGRMLGKIQNIIVSTKALASGAACTIKLEGNQGAKESSEFSITGVGKTRFVFRAIDMEAVEDARAVISFASGSTSADCPIRKIVVEGNYVER